MPMLRRFALLLAVALAASSLSATAATLKRLTHQPPDGALITFQLTDGRVLAQGFGESDWYALTPDNTGSYVNGTWKQVANLPGGYQPLYFAAAVLADGRLAIAGGEYNFDSFAFTNLSAMYDPVANAWTDITPDKRLLPFIGDSPSTVLPDGRFLVGEKFKEKVFALDPATLVWSELASKNKLDFNAEEGWVLMPDGSLLTHDVKAHPASERYLPDQGKWVDAGSTKVDLRGPQNCCGNCIPYGNGKCYDPPGEVGPAVLMPDGRVFASGAIPEGQSVSHTAIYSPPDASHPKGKWRAGPDFPPGVDGGDCPIALLPNGNVLVETDFGAGNLYEFNGTSLTKTASNAGWGSLMVLPTGEVLINGYEVYQPTGTYQAAWAPAVMSSPPSVTRGQSYPISGTQFNGLSQASGMGDEEQTVTNYPLVRITNNATGHVFYARTHDHSTMGVATGSAIVSTNFDVPSGMETGAGTLVVVANGIPSAGVAVTVN
jgi:hypothetical protein